MAITKVLVEDGCTGCGLCEDTCPEVFKVEDIAIVNQKADFSLYEDAIKESADSCPVEVIKYE